MLRIENPPDHSRSSKVPALKNDDRVSDERVAPLTVDPSGLAEYQTPCFSIRNYAFTLRSKDIGTSWPFHHQYLLLCLKHGVKDLLPPFEPPDLVRACTSTKRKNSEQLIACIDNTTSPALNHIQEEPFDSIDRVSKDFHHDPPSLSDPSVLEYSSQIHGSLPLKSKAGIDRKGSAPDNQNESSHGEAEIETTTCVHNHIESVPSSHGEHLNSDIISGLEDSLEVRIAGPHFPGKTEDSQKLSKKCRLVVKVGAIPEPPRTSDISSNSSMVSDSMASKVCPVCKIFSSTSNTTLNAHIDQCLSVENNTQQATVKPFKNKVKPIKKRLMVDIYATAALCTLEDLDKRNGTSWSLDSSLMSPSNAACNEIKRPKHYRESPAYSENDGAVYVDSNGTKLCILSKLSTGNLDRVGESSNAKSPRIVFEEPRKPSLIKNTLHGPKVSNKKKLKQKRKKRHSARLLHQMKESLAQSSSAQNKHRKGKPETLIQKNRSQHAGKPREENGQSVLKKLDSRKFSSTENTHMNLTEPPTGFSSWKTKGMNFLSSKVQERHQKDKKISSLKMKLPKSSGGYNTSPIITGVDRSKIVQIPYGARETEKVHCIVRRTSVACHPVSLDDNKLIQEESSFLANVSSPSTDANFHAKETHFSKKLRTYRPLKKSGKESSAGVSGVPQDPSVASEENYKVCVTNRSSCYLDIMDESLDTSAQTSSGQSDCGMAIKDMSLELSELGKKCKNPDGERDKSIQSLADVYNAHGSPLDQSVDGHANANTVTSEDQMVSYDASIHEPSSLEDNENLIGGTEAWVELFAPKSSMNQPMYCGNESCNAVSTPNIELASQLEFSEKGEPHANLQYMEHQATDAVVGLSSNACLTSPRVSCVEMHQENSCVTSNRTFMNDERNRDSSGSPMSASSTISHPTTGDAKDTEPQIPVPTNDKSNLEVLMSHNPPEYSRHLEPVNAEGHVPDPETVAVAHDPVKTQSKFSHCCLHGESSPLEFPRASKGKVEGLTVPSTSCFNSKPIEHPSLCSLDPSFRFETMAVDSISPRSDLDAAVKYPTCKDVRSSEPSPRIQSQGCSKPVLRLMGKNVMILNKEENLSLQEEPPCSSMNQLDQYPPLLDQCSRGDTLNLNNQQFQKMQFVESSRMMVYNSVAMQHASSPLPAGMQMNAFMGTTSQNGMKVKDPEMHQIRPHRASDLPFTYNVDNMPFHYQHQDLSCATCTRSQPREVIIIDDEPGTKAHLRRSQAFPASTLSNAFSGTNNVPLIPMTFVPSQDIYRHPREPHYGAKPGFPVSVPGTHVHAIMRGSPSSAVGPLLSGQFVGHSLSSSYHLTRHLYSPSLKQQQ